MSYQFVFEPEAIVDLDAMDATIRQRIFRKVTWLALNSEEAAPQGLSENLAGFYKLLVGDYRVMYTVNESEQLISIVRAGHRREVYDL
jgi:mRNA interferase RelE/StbE